MGSLAHVARQLYGSSELRRLLSPQSVAVFGASETPGSFGLRTMRNMARFEGRLYGINPKYESVVGQACYPSLRDLPEVPDCVVIAVARPLVEGIVEECGALGIGGAVVYASGFAETGIEERVLAQHRLAALSARTGVRLAGPNCVGLVNAIKGAGMLFMPGFDEMQLAKGPVAVVSQSGALGYTVLQGMERGVGFSYYLAAGNSCDVDICDYISYLADDADTKAIICLFEGVKDGRRLIEAGERAFAAGKALVVYKAGTSETSRQAAMSHTGTMVGAAAAYAAAFEKMGAIVTDNLESTLEIASFFAKTGAPSAQEGVGVLATSGGAAVICADKAEAYGVPLPPLSPATAEELSKVVPEFGSVANPADLTAEVLKTSETFGHCLSSFISDPGYSALVVPMVFANAASSVARAPVLCDAARTTDRPICAIWMNEWLQGPGSEIFDSDPKVPFFRSADRCFATLRAWFDWHARRTRAGTPAPRPDRVSPAGAADRAGDILQQEAKRGRSLTEIGSKRVLSAYGVPVTREILAPDEEAAVTAWRDIARPVAVKIVSPDIAHKTEVGGIRLDLNDAEAVRAAFQAVTAAGRKAVPHARIDGVVVQEMAPKGIEIIVGAKRDPQFGPLIAVGLGGVMAELLTDTAVRLAPVSADEARAMLRSLRAYPLLAGFRGTAGIDLDALVPVIQRISEFAADFAAHIEEIDVNPLIATATDIVAVDALLVAAEPA